MKTFNSKKSGVRTSDIDSSGALDIDAGTGDVTIDSASGSITLGASLTDGQTLKLGPNGATEMVFTPHGTASSEKISLTNTSGDDNDAIKLLSTAGGITIDGSSGVIVEGDAATAGKILFKEGSNNGTNSVTLIGPASTSDITVTLPSAAGTLITESETFTARSLANGATSTVHIVDHILQLHNRLLALEGSG